MPERHVIALGGGGFSMEPDRLVFDEYILQHSRSPRPRVCLLPTATGDSRQMIEGFAKAYGVFDCELFCLTLFGTTVTDFREYLLSMDVIYVTGGHTRNMLSIWRTWELDKILAEAHEAGVVLAGVSAGAACWFEAAMTDSVPGKLSRDECLGILPGSFCAHFENTGRRPEFLRQIGERILPAGYGVQNFAGLHFVNGRLHTGIVESAHAGASHFELANGDVIEKVIGSVYIS